MRTFLVLSVFLSFGLFSKLAHACSMVSCISHGDAMRSSFIVYVTLDHRPLANVSVEISTGDSQFTFKTGKDGNANVSNLAPGDYWLNVQLLGINAAYQCFHVGTSPKRKAKKKLSFEWGDWPTETRKIAGRLIDRQRNNSGTPIWNVTHPVDVPINSARLKLQSPISELSYKMASDDNGMFSFGSIPAGTYVLHIESGKIGEHDYGPADFLLRLNPTVQKAGLFFIQDEVTSWDCGGPRFELKDPPSN